MFKRLFWLSTGIAIGLATSFRVARAVRQTLRRYAPERLADDLGSAVRRFGTDVRTALEEGREAMRAREAALREELGPRR